MKKIFLGLTGNIGSGKTTVLNLFQSRGFKCLNADEMVHKMFIYNHIFYKSIAHQIDSHFNTSFSSEDIINRDILRPLIKNNPNLLTILSNIVKPFITKEILKEKNNGFDTIIEVPLLFEASNKEIYDKVILVYCNDEERQRRINIRNPNWGDSHIKTIMNSQMKQEEKMDLADYIIYNNSDDNLNEQVDNTILLIKNLNSNSSYRNK